jgi:hypothetical protein
LKVASEKIIDLVVVLLIYPVSHVEG